MTHIHKNHTEVKYEEKQLNHKENNKVTKMECCFIMLINKKRLGWSVACDRRWAIV